LKPPKAYQFHESREAFFEADGTAHLVGGLRRPVKNRAGVRVGIETLLLKISFVPFILFPLNFNSV
jgi:hypothetical protein